MTSFTMLIIKLSKHFCLDTVRVFTHHINSLKASRSYGSFTKNIFLLITVQMYVAKESNKVFTFIVRTFSVEVRHLNHVLCLTV